MPEGARPASNQIMRFFRRFAPNKAFAALRIPHKGTSTEQQECPRYKTRLELDSAVFSGAMCRTKLLPRSVFRTREHPQSSGGARGGKARLELDSAVFQAQCAEQSFCRTPYSAQGNIHRAAGVIEGARPASNQIMRFFRRKAPEKPPRSCWLRGGPAVTGMGDATRT